MKILLDAHMLGQKQTGIERCWSNLAANLKKNKNADIILYSNLSKEKLNSFASSGVKVYKPSSKNGFYRILLGFNQAIIKERPDLIHVSNFTPYTKSCPIITTVHDLCFKTYPETFKSKSLLAYNLFFKHSLDLADAVIAVSLSTKNNLINYYGVDQAKIFVVYEAPDPVFQYFENKNKLKQEIYERFKIDRDFFLVVGDVDKRKTPLSIIRAFQNFSKNNGLQLVFVGQNKMMDIINRQYKDELSKVNIRFLDYVSDYELKYLYNGASALIFNSLCEGFGLPIVEAMSCKTPVICSDIPVFREIAHNAAVFVKNEIELYKAMKLVIQDVSLRGKYAELGFQRSKFFSWDKAANDTMKIYELVLDNNRSRE